MGIRKRLLDGIFRMFTTLFSFFFGSKIGVRTQTLLRQLQTVSVGTVMGGVLVTLFTMYAARHIGPGSFGTYMLVIAIANTAMLPMLFGLNTASVHLIAKSGNAQRYIGAALALASLFAILSCLLLFWFSTTIFDWFFIPHALLLPSGVLAVLFTFAFLADAFLRGMRRMEHLSRLRLLQSLVFSVLLAVLLVSYRRAITPFAATAGGAAVFLCFALWIVRSEMKLPTSRAISSLLHYGVYALLGSIAGSLFDLMDKLLLNRLVSTAAVGVYSAYLLASVGIAGKMLSLLMIVLFPFFSSEKKCQELFQKFNHLAYRAATYLFFGTIILLVIALPLIFGAAYKFSFVLTILFAAAAGLYFFVWGRLWLISATGLHGIRLVAVTALIAVLFNAILNLLLIPLLEIVGAALANVLTLVALAVCSSALQKHVVREQQTSKHKEEQLYTE